MMSGEPEQGVSDNAPENDQDQQDQQDQDDGALNDAPASMAEAAAEADASQAAFEAAFDEEDAAKAADAGPANGEDAARDDQLSAAKQPSPAARVLLSNGGQPQNDPSDAAPSDDPWAAAPDQLRRERERLLNENQSLRGRVPGLQRELEEMRRFQAEAAAKERTSPEDGTSPDAGSPPSNEAGDNRVRAFKEEYPEIAGPVEHLLANQQQLIDDLRGRVAHHDAAFNAGALEAEAEALRADAATAALYEDVKQGGPRNAEFVEWYQLQPPGVQAMVERNGEHIADAGEARAVITLFQSETSQTSPPPAPAGEGGTSPSRDRRRRALLKSAEGVKGKPPGVGRSAPARDAFEATWDYLEEEEQEARRAS